MINFSEGKIGVGGKDVGVASDCEELNTLAEAGLIEKRVQAGNVGTYHYVEIAENGMRFGVYISLVKDGNHKLVLSWLDGPCTSKGWEGVSEKALLEEYRLLWKFVEKRAGGQPDRRDDRERTWCFKWGEVNVNYHPRDFAVGISMKPH